MGLSITISSGYRPPELNRLIGGSTTSAHPYGRAADIVVNGLTPLEVSELIRELGLPYDQVIHEFGQWVHVGISREEDNVRSQELTAYRDDKGVHYDLGLRVV